MRTKLMLGAALVLVLGAVAAGIAVAASRGGDEEPLTGATLARASAAALAHTGGGRVVETETGDDGAAYEVEIRLPSGRQVEVQLDERFVVVGDHTDDDGAADREDEAGDD